MAKVHIHIEGESAGDATKELVSLAALVQGAALGGLIDDGGDVGAPETTAPKGRGGRPRKDAAAPPADAGQTTSASATPAPDASQAPPASGQQQASAPSSAGSAAQSPPPSPPPPPPASNGGEVTVQDVLAVVGELSAKGIDAALVQDEIQRVFGVQRLGLIPKERLPEAIDVLRAFGARQALL